jgi:hypothetical protein
VVARAVRKFDTGATRSTDNTKPRYTGYLSPYVLKAFGRYMLKHQVQEDGVARAPGNWKLGIPRESYLDSLVRHTIDLWANYEDQTETNEKVEDLCCAIIFNASGFLYELRRKQRLIHVDRAGPEDKE